MRHKRTIIRILIATIAAILSAQVIPWLTIAAVWPAASPLLAICATVAARSVSLITFLGLPLLALAFIRGRWFCRHMCPTGYLLILIGKLSGRQHAYIHRFPDLGPGLCLAMLGCALAGFPLLLHLDPLVQFSGLFGFWRRLEWSWVAGLPALSLIVLGIITTIWPHLWCERICPLGGLQAMLGTVGQHCRHMRIREPRSQFMPSGGGVIARRAFLALAIGAGSGWLLNMTRKTGQATEGPIRPPGAVADPLFHGICARCGNCMRACPEGIIVPDLGSGGLGSWLTPRLDFNRRYCNEWCRACTSVCPTGAIGRIRLEVKRDLAIGTANVDRSRCLAWRDSQYCMVCHEFCSYQAVRIVEHKGVNCPEVDEARCRGCGACQSQCPAGTIRAIKVHSRKQASVPANCRMP